MNDELLRYEVAAVTLALGLWMLGYGLFLRSKGVKANAVSERNSNWYQRILIGGAGLLDLYLMLRAPFPGLDELVFTQAALIPFLAFILVLLGTAIIIASQLSMGRSWRVGVPKDENHVDELVMKGAHRFSRNPVYLGVMVFLTGVLLAAPGPFTAFSIFISYCGLRLIIRQEERYLETHFGELYKDYKKQVRRWI